VWLLGPILAATAALAAAPVPERSCPTHVEGPKPGLVRHASDLSTRDVVFHGLRGWETRRPSPVRGGDAVVKAGIGVRAGRPVTVRIARGDRDAVALDYDIEAWRREDPPRVAAGDGQPAIRFRPCVPDTKRFSDGRPIGQWTGWNGGFIVAEPRCVTLEIRRAGAQRWTRRRAGLGEECPSPRR
jgi:hypothetical protein